MPTAAEYPEAVAASRKVLHDLIVAYNSRDVAGFEAAFNFPSFRISSGRMSTLNAGDQTPERFAAEAEAVCHHAGVDRLEAIHAGPAQVHLAASFTRYRKDGSVIGSFDSVYVITCEDGRWGVKINSSYAPY